MEYPMLSVLKDMDFDIKCSATIYHNKEGNPVPRVTEILSTMIHIDKLMYWANSLGFKRISYAKELNRLADIGTEAHESIELFLTDNISNTENIPFQGFMMWYNAVSKSNKVKTLMIEETLTCDWFGGTLDLLIEIGDKVYLVDFKTSNYITYKHFLQLSAYRYMLYIVHGIIIDGIIVLQLSKEEAAFNEFILHMGNEDHYKFIEECTNAYLSLVYGYFNIRHIEERCKSIFKGVY